MQGRLTFMKLFRELTSLQNALFYSSNNRIFLKIMLNKPEVIDKDKLNTIYVRLKEVLQLKEK